MLSIIQENLVSYQESTFLLRHFGFLVSCYLFANYWVNVIRRSD